MSDTAIAGLFAWEALDSRGKPTVGCEVRLEGGSAGQATVPSGASTGRHEARELRDGEARYGGSGVRTAVANVNGEIAAAVRGLDAADQPTLDDVLRRLDGTADLSRLGANAVLAVSVAAAVAGARGRGVPLFAAVADDGAVPLLPLPMINIISGGAHAGRSIDVQDFLAVPVGAESFPEAMEWAARVRAGVAEELAARGLPVALVADEGGLGPVLPANRTALDVMVAGVERAGCGPATTSGSPSISRRPSSSSRTAITSWRPRGGSCQRPSWSRNSPDGAPLTPSSRWKTRLPRMTGTAGGWEPRGSRAASFSAMTCSSPIRTGCSAASPRALPTPSWSSRTRSAR
jgi:hypothetical protein